MICDDISDLITQARAGNSWMGLDLGTKTIGVAVSDRLLSSATPLHTIRRMKFSKDAEALLQIIENREMGAIILGLPRNMDGSEGPRCQSTRAFARNLARLTNLPIGYWDERLSTVAAERALLEADTSRKRRAKVIDHVAAGYILQGALDRARHIRTVA
ncbi:MAG: Holliday junction resolvase RuvX [Planktomarina sp.]|uniref:Holliday junction resolvase RuvX n=1 Tax=Planktomarina sp. TaxID=2024851 RepID=UPI00288CB272|nr:Holliday junction resolvase RuvX [Planktomarina sp.]MDT2031785.1 Holliday junction resolvase RuvX [Planktomarina sp.]MDT2069885.1 Holliday junction resolvase RuvX [Planktomarina sp.]